MEGKENATKNKAATVSTTGTATTATPITVATKSSTLAADATETYDTTTKTTSKELNNTTTTNDEKTYSSDSTIESAELEIISDEKSMNEENKDAAASPSQSVMNQILKAHSEQTTTAARVEIQSAVVAALPTTTTTTESELKTEPTAAELSQSVACETINDLAIANALADADAEKSESSIGTIIENQETADAAISAPPTGDLDTDQPTPTASIRSIGSFVCRICHNAENPERLVSPCLCKGSLTYVHIHCLERWISTSRNTKCELCQFQYNTEQTLRYTCIQSLRMWYSRSMSRRALQEDCQMFSLLTLVAFGIIGTLLVGIQYYFLQGHSWGLGRLWTKGWMVFFLFTTLIVYFVNIYMIVRSQLAPWYRWWRSARDIKLILENRKPFHFRPSRRLQTPPMTEATSTSASEASELPTSMSPSAIQQQQQQQQQPDQQQPPSAVILPTPSAAAAAAAIGGIKNNTTTTTTTTTVIATVAPLPTTFELQLQLNKNAATIAAIAALDAVVYNKCAKNYNNNRKKCNALLTRTAAAAAGDMNEMNANEVVVSAAAIDIPLDPVVYELATAL